MSDDNEQSEMAGRVGTCEGLEQESTQIVMDILYTDGEEFEYEVKRGDETYTKTSTRKGEPDPDMFKYYLKQYAAEKKGLGFDEMPPNAEDYVDLWISWLDENWQESTKCLVDDVDKFDDSLFNVVNREQVVEWARELWQEDDNFKNMLMSKWILDIQDGDESADDEPEFKKIQRPDIHENRKKSGQMSVDDYMQQ